MTQKLNDEDIARRARIHALKMQGEDWYVTANVLDETANEIERLRIALGDATASLERLNKPDESLARWFADHRHEFPDTFTGMCACYFTALHLAP